MRRETRQIVSFTVVFFVLLIILFPLMSGTRHALGILGIWHRTTVEWHALLYSNLSEPEMAMENSNPLEETLESESFQALMSFSLPLSSSRDALLALTARLESPYSLKSIMEIEIELDTITEELNTLSTQQLSSFESLLFVSYLLIAFLMILYGSQSRQLAIARKERSLAAELKRRTTGIYENERKKIARDLHDGLSQNIALARMSVDGLPEGNEKKQLRLSLDQSFQELRKLLFNLRSADDFSGSLTEMVKRECGLFQERFGLAVRVYEGKPFRPAWDMDHFVQFFRILHEGLINVVRHSGTGQAEVSLDSNAGFVELFIRDDGRGMGQTRPGFGVKGMKERTAILGGSIEWNSSPGKGTEIHLSVQEVLS